MNWTIYAALAGSLAACTVSPEDGDAFAPGGVGDGAGAVDPSPDAEDPGETPGDGDGDEDPGDGDGDGDADPPGADCGDGIVDDGEACDDGGESASCNGDCTAAACGDGKLNVSAGEDCDGEVDVENGGCSDQCALECDAEYGDCNADLEVDGCETWLLMPDDCGACGNACADGTACVLGQCAVTSTHGHDQEFSEGNVGLAHYLLGNKISIPAATLSHLSLISKQDGPNVVLGLYEDAGGEPGALVASTPAVPVELGKMEISIGDPVELAAGDYWLLAVYDGNASVGIDTSNGEEPVKYIPHTFANPLPNPFPVGKTYAGQTLNYYVNVVP